MRNEPSLGASRRHGAAWTGVEGGLVGSMVVYALEDIDLSIIRPVGTELQQKIYISRCNYSHILKRMRAYTPQSRPGATSLRHVSDVGNKERI